MNLTTGIAQHVSCVIEIGIRAVELYPQVREEGNGDGFANLRWTVAKCRNLSLNLRLGGSPLDRSRLALALTLLIALTLTACMQT